MSHENEILDQKGVRLNPSTRSESTPGIPKSKPETPLP